MALSDVLNGLASIDVVVSGSTIAVQNPVSRAMQRVRNANFRYLLPLSSTSATSSQRTLGGRSLRVYSIEDVYIYRPVTEGSGIEGALSALLGYMTAYESAILSSNPTASSSVKSIEMIPSVLTYPAGTSSQFFGVSCKLQIEEYS